MISLNGVRVALLRSSRLPNRGRVIGIPEDTRARLRVRVGDHLTIADQQYEVQRAFIDEVHAADQDGFPQDAMVFMRTIPRGLSVDLSVPATTTSTSRSSGTTPRPPAASRPRAEMSSRRPAPAPVEPEVQEPIAPTVEVQPLPRLEINGFNLVPCLGHSMGNDETQVVRIPSAARVMLGVNRGDVISISGRRFTVRTAARADLDRYPDLGQSEVVFFHSSVQNFPLFTGEGATTDPVVQPPAAPPVPADPAEIVSLIRGRLLTALGEPVDDPNGVMTDLIVTPEIQDGNVGITLEYLPGARGIGSPDNMDAALTGAAEQLAAEVRGMNVRNQRLLTALARV